MIRYKKMIMTLGFFDKFYHICLILTYMILSFSCSSTKKLSVKEFNPITESIPFNGTYLNDSNKLSRLFNLKSDETDFITINYDGKDSLYFSYYNEDGLQEKGYQGKQENNYFEFYFEKKRIVIPIIYSSIDIDRLRIGYNDNADLLIHNYYDRQGQLLLIAGGSAGETRREFSKFNINNYNGLIPFQENNKWGYINNKGDIVIEPQYDFARVFENTVARVKLNGKWGLIDRKGNKITEIKYTEISPFQENMFFHIKIDDKAGYINHFGEDIISPIYDEVGNFNYYTSEIIKIKKRDKFGYATKNGILYPPIFEKANDFTSNICFFTECCNQIKYGKVTYNKKKYLVDNSGYMYEYKCIFLEGLKVFEESKIKISELFE